MDWLNQASMSQLRTIVQVQHLVNLDLIRTNLYAYSNMATIILCSFMLLKTLQEL